MARISAATVAASVIGTFFGKSGSFATAAREMTRASAGRLSLCSRASASR